MSMGEILVHVIVTHMQHMLEMSPSSVSSYWFLSWMFQYLVPVVLCSYFK